MVKIKSSSGGFVNVEIKGIAETIEVLRKKGKDIESSTEIGLVQASNMMQQEVQESITGNRPEPKSVDTGRFANSISIDKVQKDVFKIYPKTSSYPNGQTTDDVALALEYGTSKINPRSHFRNSLFRNKNKAEDIVRNSIKKI